MDFKGYDMRRAIIIFLFTFLLADICIAAEFTFIPGSIGQKDARYPTIKINGKIDRYSVDEFDFYVKQAIDDARRLGLLVIEGDPSVIAYVEINSPGGLMVAGIEIGRKVREMKFGVVVQKQAHCASACVYILAGGLERTVEGRVGIHRQYTASADNLITPEQQKASYKADEKLIKSYYEKINIPTALYDRQIRIPRTEILWLSKPELQTYGLDGDDPYYDEARLSFYAKMYEGTKNEIALLISEVNKKCRKGATKLSTACLQRIYLDAFANAGLRGQRARLIFELMAGVVQVNKKTPMMFDKISQIDYVTINPAGPRIIYHLTFQNNPSKDISASRTQTIIKPLFIQGYCNKAPIKDSLRKGAILVYTFSGNDGIEASRIEINNSDCERFDLLKEGRSGR